MSTECMVFDDITPIEVPVKIVGVSYVLVEASGDAAAKFRNKQSKSAIFKDGQIVGADGVGDLEPYLVSLCLFQKDGGKPVELSWVKSLPARIVKPLFDKIKEISLLDEKETEVDLKRRLEDTQRKLTLLQGGEEAVKKPASE